MCGNQRYRYVTLHYAKVNVTPVKNMSSIHLQLINGHDGRRWGGEGEGEREEEMDRRGVGERKRAERNG